MDEKETPAPEDGDGDREEREAIQAIDAPLDLEMPEFLRRT